MRSGVSPISRRRRPSGTFFCALRHARLNATTGFTAFGRYVSSRSASLARLTRSLCVIIPPFRAHQHKVPRLWPSRTLFSAIS
jgi:hypothetical protein